MAEIFTAGLSTSTAGITFKAFGSCSAVMFPQIQWHHCFFKYFLSVGERVQCMAYGQLLAWSDCMTDGSQRRWHRLTQLLSRWCFSTAKPDSPHSSTSGRLCARFVAPRLRRNYNIVHNSGCNDNTKSSWCTQKAFPFRWIPGYNGPFRVYSNDIAK